ncbi:MAG: AAA family ATPase [Clostridia bacterium]|nr:AAA family ATPase [Clostridia bacterium]
MDKRKWSIILLFFMISIGVILFISFYNNDGNYETYQDFCHYVESSKVSEVEISDDKVFFYLKNEKEKHYTDNPEYDGFKEFLLLNNVKINHSFGISDVSDLFDILFYCIFIGAIFFCGYKLLSFTNDHFKIIRSSQTRFSDIAGMDELKSDLMKIVDVVKNPKEYKEKGIRAPKGIILEGPPGNGKTLFARAIAGEAKMNFIATKGADFQSAMMSIGPRKIKALFKKARRNKPCIIFIDEFDGIGERRNYAGTGIDKENNRLIITMLNEMDGFTNEDGVLVIAATNSYASLDAALVRPGRFDIKYKIDNPDKKTIIQLFELYTKNKKLDSKIRIEELSKCFENLSAAAIETIINEATIISEAKGKELITIEDIAEAGRKTNTVNIKVV